MRSAHIERLRIYYASNSCWNGCHLLPVENCQTSAVVFGCIDGNWFVYNNIHSHIAFAGRTVQPYWLETIYVVYYQWLVLICYIFERIFGLVSDITLLELADTNHPLLRELAEKAPGTFQHVMQVANLAEDAIRNINGNPLMARVGALYHDVGKTSAPQFFVENQVGTNPHNSLSNEESAAIIIGHVKKGEELAKAYKLPPRIIDFITTHHGTDVVRYFYNNEVNQHGADNVDASKYTYPGPSPFSKETAVVMLADSIEAASRTIKDYSQDVISSVVEDVVNDKIEHGQMNYADITFRDIETIKAIFKQKLQNIYHTRIEYPKI